MLDVGLNLLLHPIPYIVLSKSVVCSFDTLMSGDRGIMEVHDKRLALFIRAISDIDQLNSYWIQECMVDSVLPTQAKHAGNAVVAR